MSENMQIIRWYDNLMTDNNERVKQWEETVEKN